MDRLAYTIPYRPYLNRDRLIYLTHPDPKVAKALCDEFIAQGFQVSMVPDTLGLTRLMSLRRPDLVLLPLCGEERDISDALAALDAIRAQHLGIHTFLLAPPDVRAELVVAAMKHGASSVFSPPYAPVELAVAALLFAVALGIPLGYLADRSATLPQDRTVVTLCASGYRSQIAASLLQAAGFEDVVALNEGEECWSKFLPTERGATIEMATVLELQ